MSKHKLLAVMFTLVLAGLFLHSFYVQHAETESSTVTVPDDYPTIQEAINAANEGDTVFVRNGT